MKFKIIVVLIGSILLSSCAKQESTSDVSNEYMENLQTQIENLDKSIIEPNQTFDCLEIETDSNAIKKLKFREI